MNRTEKFIEWLRSEINERGWSQNELARRAGLSSGGMSLIMTQQRGVTAEVCQAIARALKDPEEEVFRHAGLLPDRPSYDVRERRALFMFDQLSVAQQEHILELMRSMVEREETEKA
jgi:transcriptional regulator with XRE-family HTH domain